MCAVDLTEVKAWLRNFLCTARTLSFAETSSGNGQCRCNFYRPATWYHMPRAFRQEDSYPEEKTHNHAKYTYAP
jgi:hypothetical protein